MNTPVYSLRSPFDVFHLLPEGHEKALKQAFYNTVALVFVVVVFLMAAAVYYIMQPFLRPLLWALLCGSAIHPFKRRLTQLFRGWLNGLGETGTPLLVGIVVLPASIFDTTSEACAQFVISYLKNIVFVALALPVLYLIYNFLPGSFLLTLYRLNVDRTFSIFNIILATRYLTWSLVIGYILLVCFWWSPESRLPLSWFSMMVWASIIFSAVSSLGPLAGPVMMIITFLIALGFVVELNVGNIFRTSPSNREPSNQQGFCSTLQTSLSNLFFESTPPSRIEALQSDNTSPESEAESSAPEMDSANSIQKVQVDPPTPEKRQNVKKPETIFTKPRHHKPARHSKRLSNLFLYGVLWACLLAEFWHHLWISYLLFIPVIYIFIKRLGNHFGLWELLSSWFLRTVVEWCNVRKDILFPSPLRGTWKLISYGDNKVRCLLEKSVDMMTSIGVISLLLIVTVLGTIFMAIQVHGESVHLMEVTGNVINRSLILPENLRNIDAVIDSMIGDAYRYGRQWIAGTVQHLIDDKDENRAATVEKQLLTLWDEAYRLWVSRNLNESNTEKMHQQMPSFKNLIDGVKNLDLDLLMSFVRENIGTFMSVLDSVWSVLKGNITLALHVLTSSLSLIFGGGFALLNFILSFVIFSTALFYLLCSSNNEYKPSELVGKLVPQSDAGVKLADAVEEAVNGVFAASFKMAAFYGLYTWFIHTLFDVGIVYIPTVLASLFGAVPFLGAYWACLPAVLELWLLHGQGLKALGMLICQILPICFVDSTFYSEIKGAGHPYLTGLAIAGGVFCMGFEGALFGPLLLCFLFVVTNIYTTLVNNSSSGLNRSSRYGHGIRSQEGLVYLILNTFLRLMLS